MKLRVPLFLLAGLIALAIFPRPGAGQYFGRNKVQYRSFDFQVVRTEHFDIYYYEREREAVMDAARMAERSYARLSRILQHEFRERKPIILYASHTDFQQTNALAGFLDESTGGVTESMKSRVIMPFTGSYADFDHVLTHELVHAFQYDIILRRGMMSEANPYMGRLPLWFMEGMAEYLSIGRIDPLTVSWLRDATLNGYLRDLREMTMRDDYLSYRFGQSLWAYIGSKWGDEVVGILLQKTPRMGIERAFASTLGISLEELSREWVAEVRQTYLPQVAEFTLPDQFAQKINGRDHINDPWFLSPAISPDGKRMLYLSQRDGFFFDLWLADAETGKPLHKLVSGSSSADFESLRYMTSSASFSPDGRYVAFAAQTGGRDALYIYDLQKRSVVRKLKFDLDGIEYPTFSADGQRIVFSGNDGGLSDLFITDLSGRLTRLTNDRYADLTPNWSPDGSYIAFTTDRGPHTDFEKLTYGNFRVALYEVATGAITVLPHQDRGKNTNPVWAPDARSLVWVNDASGTNNLHLFELDEQKLYRITDLLSGAIAIKDISPVLSWARSGRLLFSHFEKAGYSTYAVDDPRTLPRVLVAQPAVLTQAAATPSPATPSPATPSAATPSAAVSTTAATPSAATSPAALPPEATTQTADSAAAVKGSGVAVQKPTVRSYYRSGLNLRPSAQPVPTTEIAQAVSVVALLDSAMLALPDTTAFEHRDYKAKLTPDYISRPSIGAQVGGYYGNGVYGGSMIMLSDMLGNHNAIIAANVNGSLADASFLTAYSFLKKRANFGFAIQQMPLYRYYGSGYFDLERDDRTEPVAASVFVRDVIRSASASISYPFSTFQRVELGASAVHYSSDLLYRGRYIRTSEPLDRTDRLGSMKYLQPSAALVYDNTLFGWTGPVFGQRYRAQLARTVGDFQFTEALLDYRRYFNIKQTVVFAARFSGLARMGDQSERFGVYWGGPYYVRGYNANSFDLDGDECTGSRYYGGVESISPCPVRDQLIGSSAAMASVEMRVPVIKELQIGFIGSFPPVDLVGFVDGGVAWDSEVCLFTSLENPGQCDAEESQKVHLVWDRKPGQDPFLYREPLFSYGLGLRLNIFYTILRFDYAIPANRPDRSGVFSISFGPSF